MEKTLEEKSGAMVVPMLDPEIVSRIRLLRRMGWGTKRIAQEVGVARNSVRRYLREGEAAEKQERPGGRRLGGEQEEQARALLDGPAAGNAVVVRRLLAEQEVEVPLRTLQRVLAPHRQAKRAAELATVRFETAPGYQTQIDFGEKWVEIGGLLIRVFFFVAVLGYSRRIYVRASLRQRQDVQLMIRARSGSGNRRRRPLGSRAMSRQRSRRSWSFMDHERSTRRSSGQDGYREFVRRTGIPADAELAALAEEFATVK